MVQAASEMKVIFVRLPASDHKALMALAKREERSMSAQVRFAIRAMLRDSEAQPTTAAPYYGYLGTPQAQEPAAEDPGEEEHPF